MAKRVYLKPLPTAVNDSLAQSLTDRLLIAFDDLRLRLASHDVDCIDLLDLQDDLELLHVRLDDLAQQSDRSLFDLHCQIRIVGAA